MTTILEKIADCLSDLDWHSNVELKAISHRFGGYHLKLKMGEFDGQYWDIEKKERQRAWRMALQVSGYERCPSSDLPPIL